jgi:DnaJ family protein C protein 7
MMNDNQYNRDFTDRFTPGEQVSPQRGRETRRLHSALSSHPQCSVGDDQNTTSGMVWSPLPMDVDKPSTRGFSVGRALESGRRSSLVGERKKAYQVTIPNIPIGCPTSSKVNDLNGYRRKGNHAFKMGDYNTACVNYSRAIVASQSSGKEKMSKALPLLYCNRAAAYLALGKPIEALQDCKAGLKENLSFHKCRFRAVTCLIRMGQFAEAGRLLDEVSMHDPVHKEVERRRQELRNIEEQVTEYLQKLVQRGFDDLASVKDQYRIIESKVPHSDALIASLVVAHMQFEDISGADKILEGVLKRRWCKPPQWAGWCRVQTCFHKADYRQCLQNLMTLKKLILTTPSDEKIDMLDVVISVPDEESIDSMIQGIQVVEELRNSANAQMKNGLFEKALEAYSDCISSALVSPAMAAILFSNRAAAHQSMGIWAPALADCCRAVSIAPHFAKPHSRMASIFLELGMCGEARRAAEQAISVAVDPSQRTKYCSMLKTILLQGTTGGPKYHLLFGLNRDFSESDVKKAYRKLALRLHPDKTSQSTNVEYQLGNLGVQVLSAGKTRQSMHELSTWLFKLLGEAQEVLLAGS